MNVVLTELNIPSKIMETEENEIMYDELRENILKMFSLKKHISKKENEKKLLEERIRQTSNHEESTSFQNEEMKRKFPYMEKENLMKKIKVEK